MVLGNFIIFCFLKILLTIVLLVCGYYISYGKKGKEKYWQISIIAIVCYSLEMGLRWGRSWDYRHYYQDLTGELYQQYDDVLYLAWIDFFKLTGLPYWTAFIFYSALLIFGFMLLLKKYPKAAIWALPLFLFIPSGADNHARQFFSIAFGLFGYYFYYRKRWINAFVFFFCCATIHFANIFLIIVILFFDIVKLQKIAYSPIILIILYTFLYFFWNPEWLSGLANDLSKIDMGNYRAQMFLDHSDYWLSEDSDIRIKLGLRRNVVATYYIIMKLVVNNGLIYYGCKLFKRNKNFSIYFWSTILILIIGVVGGSKEIFYRFIAQLQCFEALFIGIMWYESRMKTIYERILFILIGIYYFGWVSYFRNIILPSPLGYAYIWDL